MAAAEQPPRARTGKGAGGAGPPSHHLYTDERLDLPQEVGRSSSLDARVAPALRLALARHKDGALAKLVHPTLAALDLPV